jgi:hypothetical protein
LGALVVAVGLNGGAALYPAGFLLLAWGLLLGLVLALGAGPALGVQIHVRGLRGRRAGYRVTEAELRRFVDEGPRPAA